MEAPQEPGPFVCPTGTGVPRVLTRTKSPRPTWPPRGRVRGVAWRTGAIGQAGPPKACGRFPAWGAEGWPSRRPATRCRLRPGRPAPGPGPCPQHGLAELARALAVGRGLRAAGARARPVAESPQPPSAEDPARPVHGAQQAAALPNRVSAGDAARSGPSGPGKREIRAGDGCMHLGPLEEGLGGLEIRAEPGQDKVGCAPQAGRGKGCVKSCS